MNPNQNSTKNTVENNSEIRRNELMYMSSYMAMIMKKEQLAALKMTG